MTNGTYYIHDVIEFRNNSAYCKEHDMEFPNACFMEHLTEHHQQSYYEEKK